MSGQRLKHCDPLFKKEHRSHVHCHKRKSPSYYFGDRLNAFLKKDVLENGKEYRVCDNLCRQIDAVKVVRQSTIRRARVSKDAVPGRMVSLSTNKHMRAVQKEYQLIVDLSDQASKVEKVKENFVWMGLLGIISSMIMWGCFFGGMIGVCSGSWRFGRVRSKEAGWDCLRPATF